MDRPSRPALRPVLQRRVPVQVAAATKLRRQPGVVGRHRRLLDSYRRAGGRRDMLRHLSTGEIPPHRACPAQEGVQGE